MEKFSNTCFQVILKSSPAVIFSEYSLFYKSSARSNENTHSPYGIRKVKTFAEPLLKKKR